VVHPLDDLDKMIKLLEHMPRQDCMFFQGSLPKVHELKLQFENLHEECNFPAEVLLPGQDIDEVMIKDLD